MNKPPRVKNKSVTYGIFFGIFGIPMLVAAGYLLVFLWYLLACVWSLIVAIWEHKAVIFSSVRSRIEDAATRKARAKEQREAGLAYEAFP